MSDGTDDGVACFEAWIQELSAELVRADKQFSEGRPDGGRAAAAIALDAVIKFLDTFGKPALPNRPLVTLREALDNIERGAPSVMLERHKAGRARPLSNQERRMRAYAATAVEVAMAAGKSENEAIAEVFDAFTKAGVKRGRGDTKEELTCRTIRSWREDAIGHGSNQFSMFMIEQVEKQIEEGGKPTLEVATEIVLGLAKLAARP